MPYAFQNKLCAALPRGPSRRLWLCCNSSSWLWSSDLPRKKVTWITCLEQINFWHLLNSCSSKSIKKRVKNWDPWFLNLQNTQKQITSL
jgi:hypothetical protein